MLCKHIFGGGYTMQPAMQACFPYMGVGRSSFTLAKQSLLRTSRQANFRLGCFVMCAITWQILARPRLELKTQPRFSPRANPIKNLQS